MASANLTMGDALAGFLAREIANLPEEEQIIRAQARSLTLQSTMLSENPVAIINGQVLRVGEWINGFEVTEITAHACKVSKTDVTVLLKMVQSTEN